MTRSPLAYPLNRGADMDVGGAADLQTDVMRFMAIISLCLVAIFALVQSMPMTPPSELTPEVQQQLLVEPLPLPEPEPEPDQEKEQVLQAAKPDPAPEIQQPVKYVTLTRQTGQPKYHATIVPAVETAAAPIAAPVEEVEGFILRFESDAALMRLVAASQVGVYAIDNNRARRMTVSESRISFWDASLPNSFHEMEISTVPMAVVDALARTGVATDTLDWGVTLPGKLKGQLDGLMQEHRGGSLVIGSNGNIRLEAL
jgi:hypothetical protein